MSPVPKIDSQFWFDMSHDIIKNSVTRFNDAAGKLYNFITWIYTLYIASTLLAFKFNDTVSWLIYVIPAPFILITIAAISSINAQMPVPVKFDPNISSMIEKAYKDTMYAKIRAFSIARYLTLIGSLLISVIIFYSFVLTKESDLSNEKPEEFETSYFVTKDSTVQMLVSGKLRSKKIVKCYIYVVDRATNKEVIQINEMFNTNDKGEFSRNFNVKERSDQYRVAIEWEESAYIKTLTKLSVKK